MRITESEDLGTGRINLDVLLDVYVPWEKLCTIVQDVEREYEHGGGDIRATMPSAPEGQMPAPAAPEIVLVDRAISTASDELELPVAAQVDEPYLVRSFAGSVLEGLTYFHTSKHALPRETVEARVKEYLDNPAVLACQADTASGPQFAIWIDRPNEWTGPADIVELVDICGPGSGAQSALLHHIVARTALRVVRGNVAVAPGHAHGWRVLSALRASGWQVCGARWRFLTTPSGIVVPDRGSQWPTTWYQQG